jgi:hypothetical protein
MQAMQGRIDHAHHACRQYRFTHEELGQFTGVAGAREIRVTQFPQRARREEDAIHFLHEYRLPGGADIARAHHAEGCQLLRYGIGGRCFGCRRREGLRRLMARVDGHPPFLVGHGPLLIRAHDRHQRQKRSDQTCADEYAHQRIPAGSGIQGR